MGAKIERRTDLPHAFVEELDRAADSEFDSSPVIRETKWAIPDWHATYFDDKGRLVSFLSLFERVVQFDQTPVRLVGIGNFVTFSEWRGCGFGKALMNSVHAFIFDELKAEGGLLLCSEDVMPFYLKLGWKESFARTEFSQPKGKAVWTKNTLVLMCDNFGATAKVIDLCGLPW